MPTPKHGPVLIQSTIAHGPARPARKVRNDIVAETRGYQREQYVRTQPLVDAAEQRAKDQLLFEHGSEGVRAMERMKPPLPENLSEVCECLTTEEAREELIDQVRISSNIFIGVCISIGCFTLTRQDNAVSCVDQRAFDRRAACKAVCEDLWRIQLCPASMSHVYACADIL